MYSDFFFQVDYLAHGPAANQARHSIDIDAVLLAGKIRTWGQERGAIWRTRMEEEARAAMELARADGGSDGGHNDDNRHDNEGAASLASDDSVVIVASTSVGEKEKKEAVDEKKEKGELEGSGADSPASQATTAVGATVSQLAVESAKRASEGTEGTPKKSTRAASPASQAVAAGNAGVKKTVEKKREATKEKSRVEVVEVPGVQLGVAWDAKDPRNELDNSPSQVSTFILFILSFC